MTALLAAACAGLAAWFSMGTLAVVAGPGGELARIGLLPPIWLLPVLIGLGVGVAWAIRLSPGASMPLFCSLLMFLPWIPGHAPPAFLIWTGRVAIGAWACIGLAMLVAGSLSDRRPGSSGPGESWTRNQHRAPLVAAVVACVLYIGSAWWLAGILPGGDEPHYLII